MGASFHEDRFAGESIGVESLSREETNLQEEVAETSWGTFKKGERTLGHRALRVNRFFSETFVRQASQDRTLTLDDTYARQTIAKVKARPWTTRMPP